jgi:hypothetical protein
MQTLETYSGSSAHGRRVRGGSRPALDIDSKSDSFVQTVDSRVTSFTQQIDEFELNCMYNFSKFARRREVVERVEESRTRFKFCRAVKAEAQPPHLAVYCTSILTASTLSIPKKNMAASGKPLASTQDGSSSTQTPLLADEILEDEPGQGPASSTPLSILVLYLMTIHFLLAFCEIILVAPLIKLFENSLCLRYYDFPANGVQGDLCQIPEIQGPLAKIRGWKSMCDTIPGEFALLLINFVYGFSLLTSLACGDTHREIRGSFWEEENFSNGPHRRCWIFV